MASLEKTYGSREKAERVFYALKAEGQITGVDAAEDPDDFATKLDAVLGKTAEIRAECDALMPRVSARVDEMMARQGADGDDRRYRDGPAGDHPRTKGNADT